MKNSPVETGKIIPRSAWKTLSRSATVLIVWTSGGGFLVAGFALLGDALLGGKAAPNFWSMVLGGSCMSFLGVIFLPLAVWASVTIVRRVTENGRLIIGDQQLQYVTGQDRVKVQIPFDNIRDIDFKTYDVYHFAGKFSTREKFHYVAIFLADAGRADTVLAPAVLEGDTKKLKCDVAILDCYKTPLYTFYHQLVDRVEQQRAQDSAGEVRLQRLRRREKPSPSVRDVVGWIAVGFVALCFGGACCVGSIFWVAAPRRGGPPPTVENPVPRITGDSELDRALADVGADWPAWQNGAGKLANMQPNAHRAVVAQKLAAQADATDRSKRHAMLRALVVWATPNEVPVLIKALDDDNVFARHDVLNAIGKFRDERTLAPVLRCFQEDATRGPAAQALRDMGAMAEKEVLALLDARDVGPLRRDVLDVLKDIGTQQSVPALQAVATGKDGALARSAREALKAIAARTK